MEADQVPFLERVEGGERRFGCTDVDCLRHGVVVVFEVDARLRKVDEILAKIRCDCTVLETNVEEYKAKVVSDIDQTVYALNGGVDFTNKDFAAALRVSASTFSLR